LDCIHFRVRYAAFMLAFIFPFRSISSLPLGCDCCRHAAKFNTQLSSALLFFSANAPGVYNIFMRSLEEEKRRVPFFDFLAISVDPNLGLCPSVRLGQRNIFFFPIPRVSLFFFILSTGDRKDVCVPPPSLSRFI